MTVCPEVGEVGGNSEGEGWSEGKRLSMEDEEAKEKREYQTRRGFTCSYSLHFDIENRRYIISLNQKIQQPELRPGAHYMIGEIICGNMSQ